MPELQNSLFVQFAVHHIAHAVACAGNDQQPLGETHAL